MPDSGAVTTASLSAFCARRTCASADITLPFVTLRLDSELSNAFCEMKLCFRSFWLVASVFSASASCAFADSSWPCRSMRRASRSAVSTRTSTCPACTVSPSRTVIWRTSPDTFALTVACLTGCIVPDTGRKRLSGRDSTAVRSAGANSSVTGAPLSASLPSCAFFATRIATEPAMPPTTSNTTKATITRRRVKRTPMTSPLRRPPGRSARRTAGSTPSILFGCGGG